MRYFIAILQILLIVIVMYIFVAIFIYWLRNPDLSYMQVFLAIPKAILFKWGTYVYIGR